MLAEDKSKMPIDSRAYLIELEGGLLNSLEIVTQNEDFDRANIRASLENAYLRGMMDTIKRVHPGNKK